MTPQKIRLLLGLSEAVVDDATLGVAMELAEDWCARKAAAYATTAPESAVADMTLFYLRQHLDLKGVKPSSINLPDMSMATDMVSACRLLEEHAEKEIKAQAFARGQGFRHLRAGQVSKWH